MTSPRHGSRDKMILQPILHCSHRIMTHCPVSKVPSPDIKLKMFQAREQQSPHNNVLTIEIRTSAKTFPSPKSSTTSMCILHVWSTKSDKLANEVFEAWQEIRTAKRRLEKSRKMCWSRPDDICTSRINTARKMKI